MSTLYYVPAHRLKSWVCGMRSQSASSEIDQEDADGDDGGAHDPERRIGKLRQFELIGFDLVGEGEIGQAFEDKDHTQYAEKIPHRPMESPFFDFAVS